MQAQYSRFKAIAGVVFDCDGVLLNSRRANLALYNYLRQQVGLPPMTEEQEEYVHMATYGQALDFIAPGECRSRLEPLLPSAGEAVNYSGLLQEQPGAVEVMERLRASGKRLGICTNRVGDLGPLLRRFSLDGFFDPIRTASNSKAKPDPEGLLLILKEWGVGPVEIAFVGDSRVDEQAARAAGVPFWALGNPSLAALMHFSGFPEMLTFMRAAQAA